MFAISIMNGLVMGVIYALAALGVSLVVGIMNVVNFAHGSFTSWPAISATCSPQPWG